MNRTTTAATAKTNRSLRHSARYLTVTAMLSAVAFILMYLEISIPIMPSFIKFDFSDLPALIGTFALGPVSGVLICLIKNLLHLAFSQSAFVGELSNFILGVAFVLPAGLIYKQKKTKSRALAGAIIGAVFMGVFSIFSNYFVVYPAYYKLGMAEEAVLAAYQLILPSMKSVFQCLLVFNLPFTVAKGLIATAIAMLIYKPLSPLLKGADE